VKGKVNPRKKLERRLPASWGIKCGDDPLLSTYMEHVGDEDLRSAMCALD